MAACACRFDVVQIPGLSIYYGLISPAREQEMIDYVMAREWPPTPTQSGKPLKRQTQHYGFRYNYAAGHITEKAPPIEGVIKAFLDHIGKALNFEFNQVIVNKYERNDGITPHIDTPRYGEKIITLSLGDDCVMTFSREPHVYNIYLPRRSLVVLTGDARYKWMHSISSKVAKSHLPIASDCDPMNAGKVAERPMGWRRISVTARRQ